MRLSRTRTADKSTARMVLWVLAESPQALRVGDVTSRVLMADEQEVSDVLSALLEVGLLEHRDGRWAISPRAPGAETWAEATGNDAFLQAADQPQQGDEHPLATAHNFRIELREALGTQGLWAEGTGNTYAARSYLLRVLRRYPPVRRLFHDIEPILYQPDLWKDLTEEKQQQIAGSLAVTDLKALDYFLAVVGETGETAGGPIDVPPRTDTTTPFLPLLVLSPEDLQFPFYRELARYKETAAVDVRSRSLEDIHRILGELAEKFNYEVDARPSRGLRGVLHRMGLFPNARKPATRIVTEKMKEFFDAIGPPPGWSPDGPAEAGHGN